MSVPDRLVMRGYADGPLAEALAAVPRAAFLPPRYRALADVDVPVAAVAGDPSVVAASPRATAVLLTALDPQPGHHVLVDAVEDGYLTALAAHLVGPDGHVTLATRDARLARDVGKRLAAAGFGERVTVLEDAPFRAGAFDRVLLARASPVLPTGARASLKDWGVLVARLQPEGQLDVLKTVRSGTDFADIMLGDVTPARRPLGAGVDEPWPLLRLLMVEDALVRAWRGEPGTAEEAEFQHAVEETFRPAGAGDDAHDWAVARVLFHSAYVHLLSGDLESAEDAFTASHAVLPTAEALTFLGWTWSFSGRYEDAIDACKRALEVDPSFGNALNDIGAYLLELGQPEEAAPWLWKATRAQRYTARAYPFANLARVHLMRGEEDDAEAMLERALELDPDYAPARLLLEELHGHAYDPDEGLAGA